MKKIELLSPVGNMEMLKYAVMYGADAVYLAGIRFGARKYANNFDDEELKEAIRFAHLYDVKVYVTINTLIYEKEVEDFIEYVKYIYKIGVDAVLVQDFGMLNLIRKVIPGLEVHASTQMHNNGENILNLLKECGVARVVLDREMTLNEIKKLPSGIEKEVFCHGALCVSYSGQCLFSSMIMKRSGNRGECAGLCRLPYSTLKNHEKKYYLSLKDICTIKHIDKIIESGVDSLKIEGRMKSPLYVGYMTYIYRKYIDAYYAGKFLNVSEEEMKKIKVLFNRGFTNGYIMNSQNNDMVNRESPNHIGIHLGNYELSFKKIKLHLEDELCQGDVIRFSEDNKGMTVNFLYDKNDNLISQAQAGETVYVDNFLEILKKGEVRKVASSKLNAEINKLPNRKIKINGFVKLNKGQNMVLSVSDGIREVCLEGALVEKAQKRPITIEEVKRQILKTGSTVYEFLNLDIEIDDGIFVNLKDLNNLRREVLEELNNQRMKPRENCVFHEFNFDKPQLKEKDVEINVVVETKEQLEVVQRFNYNIFSSNKELVDEKKVYSKIDENPRVINSQKYMISDLGSVELIKPEDIVHTDYMLNVVNSYTANSLIKKGVSVVGLSVEASFDDINEICQNSIPANLEVFIYGRVELMKMKFSPLEFGENVIIDRNNVQYLIKRRDNMNYLLSSDVFNTINMMKNYIEIGIRNFRIDLYSESGEETEQLLREVTNILDF